ncbi:unnamed protein product [Ectocarpus sp. 4 AP-2014]
MGTSPETTARGSSSTQAAGTTGAAAATSSSTSNDEREKLLARASLSKATLARHRSGSYGSSTKLNEVPLQWRRGSTNTDSDGAAAREEEDGGFGPSKASFGRNNARSPLVKVVGGMKPAPEKPKGNDGTTLVIAFVVMIFVGTGNRIFMKLQTYPMYNYPFFLTMLSTFIYVPVCFLYIVPMLAFGSAITPAQRTIPKFKFAVMGLLDSVAGIMGVFAVNYINNAAMIVLLQQAAIPISMSISKMFLGATYTVSQYVGASVVIAGIIVTLIPTFFGHPAGGEDVDASMQIIWSGVQVLSCIPMCLSSVYKEKALGDDDMDVIYLNGWVAVFQFLASLLFAVPSAYAMGLPVAELPQNTYEGYLCFMGENSHFTDMANLAATTGMSDMVPPDNCETAPFFVTLYLCFNLVYNIVLIVILKYGSANVLFLASTVMVPIGNVAFSLKFVPHHQDLHWSDTMGLLFILSGLVVYRFSGPVLAFLRDSSQESELDQESASRANQKSSRFVGINQLEYLEPLIKNRVWREQKARLLRSPQQIRSAFMHRLGLPPSPKVAATPTSRGPSPYMGRTATNTRGPASGYRSPAGSFRASPGSRSTTRASPTMMSSWTSPAAGYRSIPDREAPPRSLNASSGGRAAGGGRQSIGGDQA